MSSNPPTVFVVDDDPAMLDSLRWLVESDGLHAETYRSAADFLERCSPEKRGCLLLDLRMPEMSGLDLQRELQQRKIVLPVIFLTGYGSVPVAVQALKAEAFDFLEKPFNAQSLLEQIRQAIDHDAAKYRQVEERATTVVRLSRLTPREREVMNLVVEGLSNRQMAAQMGISEKTVEAHRSNLKKKLGIDGVVELVKMAITARLAVERAPR